MSPGIRCFGGCPSGKPPLCMPPLRSVPFFVFRAGLFHLAFQAPPGCACSSISATSASTKQRLKLVRRSCSAAFTVTEYLFLISRQNRIERDRTLSNGTGWDKAGLENTNTPTQEETKRGREEEVGRHHDRTAVLT